MPGSSSAPDGAACMDGIFFVENLVIKLTPFLCMATVAWTKGKHNEYDGQSNVEKVSLRCHVLNTNRTMQNQLRAPFLGDADESLIQAPASWERGRRLVI